MPRDGNERRFQAGKRQKSSLKPGRRRARAKKERVGQAGQEEMLKLVRTGVEQFILNHATVEEFLKTIRALTEKEKVYSHQLTRTVFSRIVKEAIKKRNQSISK